MKVYLIVLILITPSLGRPSVTTPDSGLDDLHGKDGERIDQLRTPETVESTEPVEQSAPHIKDDLRIHQEIAETILKSRTENKNSGGQQNVVISASVQVNQQPNATTTEPSSASKFSSTLKKHEEFDNVHRGIAVPLTMEEIEKEMEMANSKAVETSTPKEGISTWILLNGNGPTVQPEMKSSQYRAEIDKKVDKIARIKENQVNKQTLDISNAINKKNGAKLRQRPKITTTTTTTTTSTQNPEDLLPVYDEEDYEDEEDGEMEVEPVVTVKAPTKPPTKAPTKATTKKPQNNKQNQKQATTTTTTTTTEAAPTEATQKIETTTFLILEPKDAGFDMPQDRSPSGNPGKKAKRPNANNKNNNNNADKKKKKNGNKKKPASETTTELKNNTKVANVKQPHQKNKPMSTQIYNYLAREVMPTVGVGLVGLVVAGGLATYLLGGPLGALRRSYEIQDRKDDMYQFNNEEYAGADGQNEEDMFGKVIAGMPSSSLYRNNIRYPAASSPQYRPHPNQIYQQGPQMQSPYSKYGPYNRYRYPGGGYRQGAPMPAGSGYPSSYQQPSAQPQAYQQQQQPQYRYNAATNPSQAPSENIKTVYAQSQPSSGSLGQVSPVYTPDQSPSIIEQTQSSGYSVGGTMDNQLQHRSQYVVGSSVPEGPAVVTEKEAEEEVEVSTAITVPEHGPRRKRAAVDETRKISSKKINDNEIDNENDIDSNLFHKYDVKQSASVSETSQAITTESTTDDVVANTETTVLPPAGHGTAITEFFRRIVELKVRYGLSFLQNATTAFQRYLNGVQERVNSSPMFNPQY